MRISDWSSDVCSSDLIEEFLEVRKPSGVFNRKALNLHHGVLLTDEFMEAVRDGAEFNLRSPKDQSVRGTVDARSLFQKLVEKIGRASCRERVCTYVEVSVVAESLHKNNP